MRDFSDSSRFIRPAVPEDIPVILEMIHELAEFEKLTHQVVATEADYQESLFGEKPAAGALVAQEGDQLVGYAIYFPTFFNFHRTGRHLARGSLCAPGLEGAGSWKRTAQSGG